MRQKLGVIMNWKFLTILTIGLSTVLSACTDSTESKPGALPNAILPYIGQYLGEYHGTINNHEASIILSLDGDKLVFSGSDLINPACQSKVGDLTHINLNSENNKTELENAEFAFDPNLCADSILGRRISISFSGTNTLDLNFIEQSDWYWRCEDKNSDSWNADANKENCERSMTYTYITGHLEKH